MQVILFLTYYVSFVPITLCLTLSDLYPFGSQNGDTAMEKNDDGSTEDIIISTLFPFFNHQHPKLIVNTNGVVSFLQPVSTFTPDPFPIANDARMIAPFWADVDTTRGGTVWYRESVDSVLLDRASEEVRAYFPRFYRFRASWIFVATWDRVAFYGCSNCIKTNTFQAILISNGQHSFTVYNYEQIQWTTGTASGGDAETGLGGTPAQVGFNAGDGIVFFTVNASRTSDIIDVEKMSNVGIPGKFAFRIDASDITDGGCNTGGDLTITPRYGPLLGGQYLVLSGPCIETTATITATFIGSTQKFTCDRKSEFSIVCITPIFRHTGDVIILIDIENQGEKKTFRGLYTVLNPADSKHRVYRHNSDEWFAGQQSVSWEPDASELQDNETVDIHLFSLIEESNRKLSWSSQVVRQGVQRASGSAVISLPNNGFALTIRVTSPIQKSEQADRGIWSDIFPLALAPDQAYNFCHDWLKSETQMQNLPDNDVQPCPCTLDQALLDIVRFQPDPDCNMFSRTSMFSRTGNCLHRREATHCLRLVNLGPQGVDNLCCYDSANNLIDSRVKEGGSLQRYHYLGGQNVQPYITNFYFDVLPYLHCCRYSQNVYRVIGSGTSSVSNLCPSYFKHRKFSSCKNYVPPRPARANGDPHITTLDGFQYTFNGVGEFVFIKTVDERFQSQIRFEQFRKENGDLVDASVCTSFVSQHSNDSAIVEVRLNSIRIADVLVNGDVIDFEESNVHQFQGVTVMELAANSTNANVTKKELIISFTTIGIAFKAIASSNVLNILPVVGNSSLIGNVRGILGNFDEDPNNDLQSPTEEILQPNSTAEKIYDEFGILWRIAENDSLFTYEAGKSYSDYQKLSFRPTFVTPTNLPPEVEDLCGGDEECVFDYALTGSATLAAETQQFTVIFNSSVGASYELKNCDDLPTVSGGVWNASSTIEGSTATFSCYPGYEMEGESNNITCTNGSWTDFGNFTCTLIITSSTFVSTTKTLTTVSITTYITSDSITTTAEETTIIPTEGTERISTEEPTTYSPSVAYTTSTTEETTSTDESTADNSTLAYSITSATEITTGIDNSIRSTLQSTAGDTTTEISSTSTTINEGPTTTKFLSTDDSTTTSIKTTEIFTKGLTSTIASSTAEKSSTGNSTSPTTKNTTEDSIMVSASTTIMPTTTSTEDLSKEFTTSSTTTESATDSSTFVLSTTAESTPTEYSTQRESTTEESDSTTRSPMQKAIQQIDDFIKENYIYFIIGCVSVVVCSVLMSVLIYRKCLKSYKGEKKHESPEPWNPQRNHDLTTNVSANHHSEQDYHSSSAASSVGTITYSEDGDCIYKYDSK